MKPDHSKVREVLALKCRHAADRWVAAEVRYFEAVLRGAAGSRAARKARSRAIGRGDHLADLGPRLMDAGLWHFFADTVVVAAREVNSTRVHLTRAAGVRFGPPPAAHPLADPDSLLVARRRVA